MTVQVYEGIDLDGTASNADFFITSPDPGTVMITGPASRQLSGILLVQPMPA